MKTLIEEYLGFIINVLYSMIFIRGFVYVMQYIIIK